MRVLFCDRFHSEAFARLKLEKDLELSTTTKYPEKDKLAEAQALIVRSGTQVNSELLNLAPQLKLVISCTSGFNHIDVHECQQRGITATYCPDANQYSASELTMMLMLSAYRKFLPAQSLVQSGQWNRDSVIGNELYGKQLGLVGLGRIGSRVARMALAFGMNVKAFDPYTENQIPEVEPISYEELIHASDIISIHVPYTKRTRRMFRKNQFEEMLDHAILINTSRGDIISEDEMLNALNQGLFAGAALDVFDREPLPKDSPILQNSKILCTPHIGACTDEAYLRSSQIAAEKLLSFRDNKNLTDCLPPEQAWYWDNG